MTGSRPKTYKSIEDGIKNSETLYNEDRKPITSLQHREESNLHHRDGSAPTRLVGIAFSKSLIYSTNSLGSNSQSDAQIHPSFTIGLANKMKN